jgi:hypothetical protein
VRRIYGDFSGQRLKSWAEIFPKYAVAPTSNSPTRPEKRVRHCARDRRRMDLLHSARLDGFCSSSGQRLLEPPSAAIPISNRAIAQMATEDGWVGLAGAGQRLANIAFDFDPDIRLSKAKRFDPEDREPSISISQRAGPCGSEQNLQNNRRSGRLLFGCQPLQITPHPAVVREEQFPRQLAP